MFGILSNTFLFQILSSFEYFRGSDTFEYFQILSDTFGSKIVQSLKMVTLLDIISLSNEFLRLLLVNDSSLSESSSIPRTLLTISIHIVCLLVAISLGLVIFLLSYVK